MVLYQFHFDNTLKLHQGLYSISHDIFLVFLTTCFTFCVLHLFDINKTSLVSTITKSSTSIKAISFSSLSCNTMLFLDSHSSIIFSFLILFSSIYSQILSKLPRSLHFKSMLIQYIFFDFSAIQVSKGIASTSL